VSTGEGNKRKERNMHQIRIGTESAASGTNFLFFWIQILQKLWLLFSPFSNPNIFHVIARSSIQLLSFPSKISLPVAIKILKTFQFKKKWALYQERKKKDWAAFCF
jgi:hypothetical protein